MNRTTEHYVTLPAIYPSTMELNSTTTASNVTNGTIIWSSPPYHKDLWILLVVIHIGLPILAIVFCHFMGPNLNPKLASYRSKKKKADEEAKQKAAKSNMSDAIKQKSSKASSGSMVEDKKSSLHQQPLCLSKDTAPPHFIKMMASDESADKSSSAKHSPSDIHKSSTSRSAICFKPHPVTKIPPPSLMSLRAEKDTPRSLDTLMKQNSTTKVRSSRSKKPIESKLSTTSVWALSKDSGPSALSDKSDDNSSKLRSKSVATKSVTSVKSRSSTAKSDVSTLSVSSVAKKSKSSKK